MITTKYSVSNLIDFWVDKINEIYCKLKDAVDII